MTAHSESNVTAMNSERLCYRPVAASDAEALHRLLTDPHVREYLMDGEIENLAWMEVRIADSLAAFDACGLGLWLVYESERPAGPAIGLGGFIEFPEISEAEPQLLYALYEPFTGQGYATEIARTMIARGFAKGLLRIFTGVDAPNKASIAVLDKLGFRRCGSCPGNFGEILLFELTG